MIVGPQEHFRTVGMDPAADLDELRDQIETAAAAVSGTDGTLVFVDLMGGSPANASSYLALSGTPVVCGCNLPMLLEVLMQRKHTSSAQQLAEQAIRSGRESILNLAQMLSGA